MVYVSDGSALGDILANLQSATVADVKTAFLGVIGNTPLQDAYTSLKTSLAEQKANGAVLSDNIVRGFRQAFIEANGSSQFEVYDQQQVTNILSTLTSVPEGITLIKVALDPSNVDMTGNMSDIAHIVEAVDSELVKVYYNDKLLKELRYYNRNGSQYFTLENSNVQLVVNGIIPTTVGNITVLGFGSGVLSLTPVHKFTELIRDLTPTGEEIPNTNNITFFKHKFTTNAAGEYAVFMAHNGSPWEEYINGLFKAGSNVNILSPTVATIQNTTIFELVSRQEGADAYYTIRAIGEGEYINNTTSPDFVLTLEANTTYYLTAASIIQNDTLPIVASLQTAVDSAQAAHDAAQNNLTELVADESDQVTIDAAQAELATAADVLTAAQTALDATQGVQQYELGMAIEKDDVTFDLTYEDVYEPHLRFIKLDGDLITLETSKFSGDVQLYNMNGTYIGRFTVLSTTNGRREDKHLDEFNSEGVVGEAYFRMDITQGSYNNLFSSTAYVSTGNNLSFLLDTPELPLQSAIVVNDKYGHVYNPVKVDLNIEVTAQGEVKIFSTTVQDPQNIIDAQYELPVSCFYDAANSHGLFEFWEPAADAAEDAGGAIGINDVACRLANKVNGTEESKHWDITARKLARNLHRMFCGQFDAKEATPFDNDNYKTGDAPNRVPNELYTKPYHFGRLALGTYAHYIFGHVAATAAISNDKEMMEKMLSLNSGYVDGTGIENNEPNPGPKKRYNAWEHMGKTAQEIDFNNVNDWVQASSNDANLALRMTWALVSKGLNHSKTGAVTSIATANSYKVSRFSENDNGSLAHIVKQVIGQDANRGKTGDNNELEPDVHQFLRFYPGDTIFMRVKVNAPTVSTGDGQLESLSNLGQDVTYNVRVLLRSEDPALDPNDDGLAYVIPPPAPA